ncbi:MAG TPA: hypothetical protein VFK24_10765 [Gammaproteobacteria bacterium]|nr:hypothetical protein [Gammaproteobacteria bacterium]
MSLDAAIRDTILQAGVAAPSADNSQPWCFRWAGDALDVRIDATRSGGPSDARYVLSDLAVGTCIENMLVRGHSLGYDANVAFFPDEDDPLWPARLYWRAEAITDAPLADAIERRHTDRRFPWRGPVGGDERQRLEEQAECHGAHLHWFDEPAARRRALSVLHQAEALRFKSPQLHAELFATVRFNAGWQTTCPEGLPPAVLAVERPIQSLFQALRKPGLMAMLNRLGGARLLGFRSAALPARLSPGLCLLSVNGATRSGIVAAGRALERVWLEATLAGLAVQPFAAPGVLGLGFIDIEAALRPHVARLQTEMRELCPQGQGIIFLRLGRIGPGLRWRTGRRPLTEFTGGGHGDNL